MYQLKKRSAVVRNMLFCVTVFSVIFNCCAMKVADKKTMLEKDWLTAYKQGRDAKKHKECVDLDYEAACVKYKKYPSENSLRLLNEERERANSAQKNYEQAQKRADSLRQQLSDFENAHNPKIFEVGS